MIEKKWFYPVMIFTILLLGIPATIYRWPMWTSLLAGWLAVFVSTIITKPKKNKPQ